MVPWWARVSVDKRLVLGLALGGALAGALISVATPKVYSARVLIRIDSTQPGCGGAFEQPVRPLPVRLASQLDAVAVRLGLPSPKLEANMPAVP